MSQYMYARIALIRQRLTTDHTGKYHEIPKASEGHACVLDPRRPVSPLQGVKIHRIPLKKIIATLFTPHSNTPDQDAQTPKAPMLATIPLHRFAGWFHTSH